MYTFYTFFFNIYITIILQYFLVSVLFGNGTEKVFSLTFSEKTSITYHKIFNKHKTEFIRFLSGTQFFTVYEH